MAILVGMDEAGYGPNFGPLVVAATAWEVADVGAGFGGKGSEFRAQIRRGEVQGSVNTDSSANGRCRPRRTNSASATLLAKSPNRSPSDEIDLYRLLRPLVGRTPSERRLAIADSKLLYKSGLGLRQLERGVHAALDCVKQPSASWSALVDCCAADPDEHAQKQPWHCGFDCPVPVDAKSEELSRLAERLARSCASAGVRPLAIRARLVFPAQFNGLVEHYGSKGAALSHVTVGLLREVMDSFQLDRRPPADFGELSRVEPVSPVLVVCDKHGGRNYYAALLQHHFSEHWIAPVFESGAESVYEWGTDAWSVRAKFRVGGESFLPTALASMTAKYFRELAMRAFNDFWRARVPNLQPTAGYPMDSHRFRRDIAATQRALGIDNHILWRNR